MEEPIKPTEETAQTETPKVDAEFVAPEDIEKKRVIAALGYIPFLCFLPLLMKDKGDFLAFHARQGLVITLLSVIMAVIGPVLVIFVPLFGALVAFCLNTGLALLIIVGAWKAYQGEMWELPIFGEYAKNIKV